ncbi:YncE family protein [Herbidospora cretacea]|uniref:YncE family protein n=1 Tax=Herbidospora cretacea TaxID=28444 RepID=UPI000B1A40DA|nr:hypothetical protein [Herbidospora cretacea]
MRRRLEKAPAATPTPGSGPGGAGTGATVAVSGRDRVYTADQTSNTVSVVDPSANRLLGVIRLGDPVPASLSPLYKGQLLVHGLGFSRDLRSVLHPRRQAGLGDRARPGLRLGDRPGGDEGVRRVPTANGPGMVLFHPNGRYAYVPSSFTPERAFAYVTVGEENAVKVYRRDGANPRLVATIPTGDLPHGVWTSGDGARVYVGLENQDAVLAIDALANRAITTIPVGQQPMALVYVPEAVPSGPGTSGLVPLGVAARNGHIALIAPGGDRRKGHATVSVNSLGSLDLLEMAASGLTPGEAYTLWLTDTRNARTGPRAADPLTGRGRVSS